MDEWREANHVFSWGRSARAVRLGNRTLIKTINTKNVLATKQAAAVAVAAAEINFPKGR